MRYVLFLLLSALAGCSSDATYREADGKILCDQQGKAYSVEKWVGDNSFVKRQADADRLCK